jgi:CheY-like chemotaxis protein
VYHLLLVIHEITIEKQAEREREDIIGFVAHELRRVTELNIQTAAPLSCWMLLSAMEQSQWRLPIKGWAYLPNSYPYISGRFFRAEKTKNLEGIGLGLLLCRRIIDAHKGRGWAEAKKAKALYFNFIYQLHELLFENVESMKRILIVNNDPDTMVLLKDLLQLKGSKVSFTSDKETVPAWIKDFSSYLILLDITQTAVIEQVQNQAKVFHASILLMTGHNRYPLAPHESFKKYIKKPFTPDQLYNKISEVLQNA